MEPDDDFVAADAIAGALAAVRQPADAICDRWTLEIVLHLLPGERRFTDLVRLTKIASRLVASRLVALQIIGVVDRTPYSDAPLRHVYFLTKMGADLRSVFTQMIGWERRWSGGDRADSDFQSVLIDQAALASTCAACGGSVTARDVDLRIDRALLQRPAVKQKARRRTSLALPNRKPSNNPIPESLSIFGDKWGIEILICAFFAIRRFNDFRSATGISGTILADRLCRLTSAGILATARPGSAFPGYWLTAKGIDLYPVTLAVQTWADHWLPDRIRSPVRLFHRSCGMEVVLR